MPSCAVSSCRNSTNTRLSPVTNAPPRFHSFPRGPGQGGLAQHWLNLCKRSDHVNVQKAVICSDHFLESDYERNLQAELLNLDTPRRLKKGAVPTLYLPKTVGLKGTTKAQKIKEPSKGEASRMKRIETRDRKKLVESLINKSTTEDKSPTEKPSEQKQMNRKKSDLALNASQSSNSQDNLAHCINLNGRCIFCLDTPTPIHDLESSLKRNGLQDFSEIWPYIQPNWNDNLIPGYAFLNGRNHNPSKMPPICSSCQEQIFMVASLLKKISALSLQLKKLENDARVVGLELQKKTIPGKLFEQNYGVYDCRYKTLLAELVKERVSWKVMENTITFLNQLRGFAVDVCEEGSKTLSPSSSSSSEKPRNLKIVTSCPTTRETENEDIVKLESEPKLEDLLEESEGETDYFMNAEVDSSLPFPSDPDPLSPEGEEDEVKTDQIVSNETTSTQQENVVGPTQICEVCAVHIPLRNIYDHMHSHVGDFAYKCPNPCCNYTFLTRYSIGFLTHRLKNKNCWYSGADNPSFQNACEKCSQSNFPGTLLFGHHLKTHETSQKNFICPLKPCNDGFTLRQSLEYHLHTSHDPERIRKSQKESLQKCVKSSCHTLNYLNPEEMLSHLKEHHQLEEVDVERCKFCPFIFADQDDLIQHVAIHSKREGGIPCDICDTSLLNELSTKKHYYEEHGIGRKLICDRDESCEYSCFTKECMRKHLSRGHDNKKMRHSKMKCSSCERSFTTERHLRHHEKTHLPTRKKNLYLYKCSFSSCERSFKLPESLKRHMKSHSKGNICDICGKQFKRSSSLQLHKRIHTGERPHKCHICGQRFRQIVALKKHLRSKLVHKEMEKVDDDSLSVEKPKKDNEPHHCQICGKGFRYHYTLKKHLKQGHEKEKNDVKKKYIRGKRIRYKCSSCEKSFPSPGLLNEHVKYSHLGEKGDHICDACGAQYKNKFNLEEHKRIHTGERPHQCHICGYKFRYKGNLWKHLGRAHKKKVEESSSALSGEK